MIKIITKKYYKCGLCEIEYKSKKECLKCESKPISEDKGVKVGDIVNIIRGEGIGRGEVECVHICSIGYGHYAWERYWHTVRLVVDCLDSHGSRILTFDEYELINHD